MRRRTHLLACTLSAGALAAMGLGSPLAAADTAKPTESYTHVPAPLAHLKDCEIPPDRDLNISHVVYDTAAARAVTPKVMLAAFETGWVESHMNNLPCGDRDSLGVFQQRPSQGWGTEEQCMDPVYAANAFLDRAIPNDIDNPAYTAGQLAQSVQRSAKPDEYDKAQATAEAMIAEVAPPPPPPPGPPPPPPPPPGEVA